jgi:hypothetical protein
MSGGEGFSFFDSWPEFFTILLLVFGIILAFGAPSLFMSYVIVFFCGAIFGRIRFERRRNFMLPYFIIIMGFLIGYMIGGLAGSFSNPLIITALFFIGDFLTYRVYEKGYLKDTFF